MQRKLRHKFTPHKYNAKKTCVDGITFDSLLEARYYKKLKLLKNAGEVLFFIRQPQFDISGGTKYRADFLIFWKDETVTIEDCKGMMTKDFIKAKKQVESIYPIQIKIITSKDI
jgi:hypothetical protein